MDIVYCEKRLAEMAYPPGCHWRLLFREMAQDSKCAVAWWSTILRPEGGLYLVTRISDMGQLASALKTEETAVEDDTTPFHYSRYPKHLYQVICSLWDRDWMKTIETLRIHRNSRLLQEWVTTLDTFEGSNYFQEEHATYVLLKKEEETQRKLGFGKVEAKARAQAKQAPRKSPRKTPRKKKQTKYAPLDWDNRWNQK